MGPGSLLVTFHGNGDRRLVEDLIGMYNRHSVVLVIYITFATERFMRDFLDELGVSSVEPMALTDGAIAIQCSSLEEVMGLKQKYGDLGQAVIYRNGSELSLN